MAPYDELSETIERIVLQESSAEESLTRAFQDYAPPTLFIGLGGSGTETIARVMLRWAAKAGDVARRRVRFLCIDTPDLQDQTSPEIRAAFMGRDGDYVALCGANQGGLNRWLAVERAHPGAESKFDWYDDERFPAPGSQFTVAGAGGIRQVGRLALCRSVANVKNAISDRFGQLQQAARDGAPGADPNVQVVIACGTCGGTGSGILLDVIRLVHATYQPMMGESPKIKLVLIGPDVYYAENAKDIELQARQYPNAYALLKEIDFTLSPQANNEQIEKMTLPQIEDRYLAGDREFVTYCYIMEGDLGNGECIVKRSSMIDLAAEAVFTIALSTAGGQADQQAIDGGLPAIRRIVPNTSRRTAYSGVGTARAVVPVHSVISWHAHQLFHDVVMGFLTQEAPPLSTEVEQQTVVARDELLRRLTAPADEMEQLANAAQAQIDSYRPSARGTTVDDVEAYEKNLGGQVRSAERGLKTECDAMCTTAKDSATRLLRHYVDSCPAGPAAAARDLDMIQYEILEKLGTFLARDKAAKADQEGRSTERQADSNRIASRKNSWLYKWSRALMKGSDDPVLTRYADSLRDTANAQFELEAYHQILEYLSYLANKQESPTIDAVTGSTVMRDGLAEIRRWSQAASSAANGLRTRANSYANRSFALTGPDGRLTETTVLFPVYLRNGDARNAQRATDELKAVYTAAVYDGEPTALAEIGARAISLLLEDERFEGTGIRIAGDDDAGLQLASARLTGALAEIVRQELLRSPAGSKLLKADVIEIAEEDGVGLAHLTALLSELGSPMWSVHEYGARPHSGTATLCINNPDRLQGGLAGMRIVPGAGTHEIEYLATDNGAALMDFTRLTQASSAYREWVDRPNSEPIHMDRRFSEVLPDPIAELGEVREAVYEALVLGEIAGAALEAAGREYDPRVLVSFRQNVTPPDRLPSPIRHKRGYTLGSYAYDRSLSEGHRVVFAPELGERPLGEDIYAAAQSLSAMHGDVVDAILELSRAVLDPERSRLHISPEFLKKKFEATMRRFEEQAGREEQEGDLEDAATLRRMVLEARQEIEIIDEVLMWERDKKAFADGQKPASPDTAE